MTDEISIVIAHDVKRGDIYLNQCLDSIRKESCTEIIVRTDKNLSEARNNGVLESHGNIILFFDDDVVLREGCIKELLRPFAFEEVGVVGGVNIAFPNIDFKEEIAASLLSSPLAMFRSVSRYTPRGNIRESDEAELLSCNMAVRRKAFFDAGGFPTDIIPCEENVLVNNVHKKGWKIIYNPFAVVYHRRPRIFMEYWRTIFEYGRGRGIMMRKGEGAPRMLWTPNKRWLYYSIGLLGHYVSYCCGVLIGWIKGK